MTFTNLPSQFSFLVTYLISSALFGENFLSPVIITYFACWSKSFPPFFMVFQSTGFIPPDLRNKLRLCDIVALYLPKPISSNARAIGTIPPSIYCEYTKTIPVDSRIFWHTCAILAPYFSKFTELNILPYFFSTSGLYSKSVRLKRSSLYCIICERPPFPIIFLIILDEFVNILDAIAASKLYK